MIIMIAAMRLYSDYITSHNLVILNVHYCVCSCQHSATYYNYWTLCLKDLMVLSFEVQ